MLPQMFDDSLVGGEGRSQAGGTDSGMRVVEGGGVPRFDCSKHAVSRVVDLCVQWQYLKRGC